MALRMEGFIDSTTRGSESNDSRDAEKLAQGDCSLGGAGGFACHRVSTTIESPVTKPDVGRSPWTAADALVGLCFLVRADEGVRPTLVAIGTLETRHKS
jgi:hypothetical protein